MELLTLIASNLMRRRRSVLLVWIWIMASTAIALLLSSAALGTEQVAKEQMESLAGITHVNVVGTFGGKGTAALSDEVVDLLRAVPGVKNVVPVDYVAGEVRFGPYASFPQFTGVGLEDVSELGYSAQQGTTALTRAKVILGYEVPRQFFLRNRPEKQTEGPGLDLTGRVIKLVLLKSTSDGEEIRRQYSLQVVGVLAQTGSGADYSAFIPIEDSERFKEWLGGSDFSRRQNGFDMLIAVTDGIDSVGSVQETVVSQGYIAESRIGDIRRVQNTTETLRTATISVGGMALLSCVIGIFLTTLNVVTERKAEIGLMMAVGATQRKVLTVFMSEAAMIGFSGSLGGILAAVLLRSLVDQWRLTQVVEEGESAVLGQALQGIAFTTPIWLVGLLVALITAFSVLGGILPARRAAQINPIEALRDA